MGLLRGRDYLSLDLCSFAGDKMMRRGFYMSTLKNGVLLRNRKAESRPLMKVICSLLLFAPCLSALMISCCEYFLINVKLRDTAIFSFANCQRRDFSGGRRKSQFI